MNVKAEILVEIQATVDEMIAVSTVTLKALRCLAGQANCVASLLHVWRPFVSMLWAPLYDMRSRCPFGAGRVWRCALDIPLYWIRAFMSKSRGTLERKYRLSDDLGLGQQYSITTDASPTRMGAWLMIDGVIEEFFSVEVTWIDQEVLDTRAGGSEGQQLWESLTVLIALRLWAPHWKERRIRLCVRSDTVSAHSELQLLPSHGVPPTSNGRAAADRHLTRLTHPVGTKTKVWQPGQLA